MASRPDFWTRSRTSASTHVGMDGARRRRYASLVPLAEAATKMFGRSGATGTPQRMPVGFTAKATVYRAVSRAAPPNKALFGDCREHSTPTPRPRLCSRSSSARVPLLSSLAYFSTGRGSRWPISCAKEIAPLGLSNEPRTPPRTSRERGSAGIDPESRPTLSLTLRA